MLVVAPQTVSLLTSLDVLSIDEDFEVKNVTPLLIELHLGDLQHQLILASQNYFREVSCWHAVIHLVPVLLVEHDAERLVVAGRTLHEEDQHGILLRPLVLLFLFLFIGLGFVVFLIFG